MTDINFDNVDFSKFEKNEDSQIDPVTGIDVSRFAPDPQAPARKEAFIRAQLKAQNVTHDKAVSAKNDGKALGVDYESALNNPDIIKQRKIAESAYYDDLAKKYPSTALFLNDPQNYAIAQGDEENLGLFEKSVKALDELGSAFGAGWRGMAAQDEGKIYFDKHILGKDLTKYDVKSHSRAGVNPTITGEQRLAQSIKDTQLYGQETQYYAKKGVAPDMMRATGYGFANLGYMAKNYVESLGSTIADLWEEGAVPAAVGVGVLAATKGKAANIPKVKDVASKLLQADAYAFVATDSFKQNTNEAHQLYTGVRDEEGNPMPANIAKTAAIMSGGLNAALDAAQLKMITSTFSPVVQAALRKLGKKGMNEAIAEALKRKTGRDIVAKYITTSGKLVLAEGAVEGTQSIIKDTIRLIAEGTAEKQGNAKFVSPTLFQGTDKEDSILSRAGHDSLEAIKSTLAIGFLGASPKAFAEQNLQRDIAKFEEDKAKLDAVNDAVNGTETVVRDPDTIARLARSFGGDADTKQLYMDAEKTRDLFQGLEPQLDPVDIVNELFGQETANRFSEALSTSTTFAVPFDAYVVKVMATGLYEQAKDFTQLNAYSLTAEDIANFEAMQQGHLNDLLKSQENIENAPSAVKQVYDDIYGQIESLNLPFLSKQDRKLFATLWAKKMATASIRKHQTPDKAFEMYDAPYKTKFVNEISKLNDIARGHYDNTVDPLIDSLRAGTIPKDSEIYGDTLMEGLRKLGIYDDRGDLKAMDVDKELKPFQRKLLRDDGMSLDDAAQWAVDNGYIQEADTNSLLAAIDNDLRGNPVYNMTNPNVERLERKQRIEQLQDYFDKQGINISEFTNEELKALLRGDNQLFQQDLNQIDEVRAKYEGTNQWMKSPNGKPTKLNEVQWLQVRTPNFKAWFGDWENDPKNASKVVDSETKEPMVVYHGSKADFDTFSHEFIGSNGTMEGKGFYFTDKRSIANNYGNNGKVYEVFLNIKDSLSYDSVTLNKQKLSKFIKYIDPKGDDFLSNYGDVDYEGYQKVMNQAVKSLLDGSESDVDMLHDILNSSGLNVEKYLGDIKKSLGRDGIFVENTTWGDGQKIFVAFDPTQIKSAIGNTGEFSASNPNILYQSSSSIPIYRIDAQGFDKNIVKPHGLYVSIPSDASTFDSPHKEVGNTSFSGYATPKNPLNVESVKIQHKRGKDYPIETSAGVSALKRLVDAKLFDSLIKADKAELTATIKEQFPDIDTSQYYDAYELLEVLGAQLAKQEGYDAIIQKVEGDPMNEMVILDNSIVGELDKRELFQSLSDDKETRLYQISAWHGSPFKFDKFTLDAIGSGEGAQVYGWGLYFASEKKVADWYRESLISRWDNITIRGQRLEDQQSDVAIAVRSFLRDGGNFSKWKKDTAARMERSAINGAGYGRPERALELQTAAKEIKGLSRADIDDKGQLYKVSIPSEDNMLLWDKPLSEQTDSVKESLEKQFSLESFNKDYATAADFYKSRVRKFNSDKKASEELNVLGITGIKYLDGSSRFAGEGTYNYVVFDDKAVEILQTYYQSLGQGAKGFLSIQANREMSITLKGNADFSTLLHESAHLWLEMMLDDLKSADVTQQAKDDWSVISNYFAGYADKAKSEIIADHASLERDIKKLEGMKKRSAEKELELRQKTAMLEAHKKAIAMIESNPDLLTQVAQDFGQSITENSVRNVLTKPYHEQFARSMEAYFREGKAPSTDLLEAFASFKKWLVEIIYPFLQMLGVTLSDDVRGVFDRMLATDAEIESVQQIQQAQKNFDAKMLKEFGMSDEQIDQYEKLALASTTDAEDKLRAEVMRDELKKKKEEYQQELESIKQEVADEFSQRPIQILLHFLRTGEFKEGTDSLFPIEATRLNTQDIVDTFGKQQLELLPRGVYGHNGTHPDLIANAFGISSGSKMIEDLINEPLNTQAKANIYIKEEANRRMGDLHPDLVSIDALSAEAQKAIHGDKRAELLIAEMNALSKKTNKPFTSAAMLFDFAQRQFDKLLVEDINAAKYLTAERKINRDIRKQIADGDFESALVSVQKALFNQYMYNRAIKVEEQIKNGIEAAKRYDKKAVREKIAKGGAQEYIVLQDGNNVATFSTKSEAMAYSELNDGTYVSTQNSYLEMIDSIRGSYSFKKVPKWLISQQDLFAKLYRDALNEGLALPFDPEQFAPPKNYTKLTFAEFNDVIGALKVIEKVSNLSQGMETQYGKLDMDEVLTMMEQSVKGLKSRNIKFEHNKHFVDRAIEGIDSFAAFQSTIDSYVHALDGLEPGIFHDVLTLPQRKAFIKEHTMLIQKDERVNDVFSPVYKEVDKKDILGQARAGKSLEKLSTMDLDKVLLGNRVHLASLNIDLSIQDIMGIAWLMGHKGGRDALMHPEMAYNAKSGGLWTEENILKALEVLTPVQLKAVNDGWALYEKYWPEAQSLDLRTLGYAPPKVDAIPYKIGDVEMTGGYSRLMYNKKDGWDKFTNFNEKAETMEDIVTGSGTRSQTNAGSTKERVGSGGKPPRLDFGVMDEHLNEIIHDIANREMVMQTYKLLKNQRFRNIIHSKLGGAALGQFNPWLLRLTKGEVNPTSILEAMVGKANNGTSIMFLGLSLFNAIQNATGLPVAAGLLGGNWVALGMAEFAKNPSAAVQFTMSKSGLIYVRRTTNQYSNDAKRALKNESFTGTGGSVARLAYAPQQIVQNMVDAAVWLGAYRKATAGKAAGVDKLNDAECVAFADRMIENTQSSGAIKDLSNLFARGEYMRMLTLMGSYFNMIFNMGRIRAGKRKYEPMTSRYYHDAMFALYVAAMPVLITSLMRFTAPEDDETWDEWAVRTGTYRDLAAYPFATVVVVRSAATAWAHPEYGFNAVPTLAWGEGIFKGTMAAGKLFDEDSEIERKDYKKMVEGAGYLFALPTRSVYKSGEPLYDYIDGNESGVDELRVLRSVIFGKPRED